MGKHVVTDQQIRPDIVRYQILCRCFAKKFNQGGNAFLHGYFGNVIGRFDSVYFDALLHEVLKHVAIIAGDFNDLRLLVKSKALHYPVGIVGTMFEPGIGERGEVCIFSTEDTDSIHMLEYLNEKTLVAYKCLKRIEGLHLIELLSSQKALAERRFAQIYHQLVKVSTAKSASLLHWRLCSLVGTRLRGLCFSLNLIYFRLVLANCPYLANKNIYGSPCVDFT